jgi:hypothetical protein
MGKFEISDTVWKMIADNFCPAVDRIYTFDKCYVINPSMEGCRDCWLQVAERMYGRDRDDTA